MGGRRGECVCVPLQGRGRLRVAELLAHVPDQQVADMGPATHRGEKSLGLLTEIIRQGYGSQHDSPAQAGWASP